MIRDLRTIIEGWEYEPGKISVRKIVGADGREKIQTRIDLGLIQFEPLGRPDGRRPYGCGSMLEFFETRLREHIEATGSDAGFVLLPEDCRDLRHESHLYYQRYLSLFVLEEYDGVERDTERNLRAIELCRRYAESEYDRTALETQRPYVIMMNTRARAYQALSLVDYYGALECVQDGVEQINACEADDDLDEDTSVDAEIGVLESLREEIIQQMPVDATPRLELELREALAAENYERAAEIRDRLARA